MRNLTLEGKIIVFKTLALSKMIHLCLTLVATKQIIEETSFGTGQLGKLNIVLYVILLQQVI